MSQRPPGHAPIYLFHLWTERSTWLVLCIISRRFATKFCGENIMPKGHQHAKEWFWFDVNRPICAKNDFSHFSS